MNDIVLIGKVTGSTPNLLQLEYPSINGVHSIRLQRDMVARFEKISNNRVAVLIRTDESERGQLLDEELVTKFAPLHVTDEQMAIVMAMENNEGIPEDFEQNTDDEVPMWSNETVQSVIEGVYDEEGNQVDSTKPFNNMLYSGGRGEKICNAFFKPKRSPVFVMNKQRATVERINNAQGEPCAFSITNPDLASEHRPAGALLGIFSASYEPLSHEDAFSQPMVLAAEKGFPAQIIAWDEGKRAACFIDVTSSMDDELWDKVSSDLGEKWNRRGFRNVGDYRVGIVIYNSLDGSSSYKVQVVAERLACANGQVMGDRATVVSLKHTKGVLGNFDFSKLANAIMEVIETAAKEIIITESMKDIQVGRDTFEKLMTICERKGLIAKPTVKRDDAGDVTALTRGHMWRLMGQGWTQPSEPWVSVEHEDRGSLYHVYNILTGAITHKPTWTDGKTVLNGSTLNLSTFTDRLQTVHKVLGDITTKSIDGVDIDTQLDKVPMFSEILY
tara:strand:+ start:1072 stop:2574 length:1503 start_codon:yes stop_codon:yes gene_type:complete